MAENITIDSFFKQSSKSNPLPIEVINFAAVLGTERTDSPNSVWNGDDFGSDLGKRASKPGASRLVQNEVARVLSVAGLTGDVTAERISLTSINVDLAIDEEGVSLATAP